MTANTSTTDRRKESASPTEQFLAPSQFPLFPCTWPLDVEVLFYFVVLLPFLGKGYAGKGGLLDNGFSTRIEGPTHYCQNMVSLFFLCSQTGWCCSGVHGSDAWTASPSFRELERWPDPNKGLLVLISRLNGETTRCWFSTIDSFFNVFHEWRTFFVLSLRYHFHTKSIIVCVFSPQVSLGASACVLIFQYESYYE
jgi:hypothetical protein